MAGARNFIRDESRLVEGDVLRRLQVPVPGAAFRAVAVSHLGLVVAFGLALIAHAPWAYAIAVVLAVGVQTRLAVLMHEAAHGLVHRDRRLNDRLGNWLAAYAMGTTVDAYRTNWIVSPNPCSGVSSSVRPEMSWPIHRGLRSEGSRAELAGG